LVVLTQTIDSTIVINGNDQSRRGICLPMIKACNSLPCRRNLKVRVTNDDLVCVAIENFRKQKFSTAGIVNNFLLAIPGALRTVLLPLALCPLRVALRVGGVMHSYDLYSEPRATSRNPLDVVHKAPD